MERIPEEVILNIIGFLDMHSFSSITLTCKLFQRLCNDKNILLKLIYNTYPWLKHNIAIDLYLNHKECYQKITTLYKKIQNELSEPIPTTVVHYPPREDYPDLNCDYFVKDNIPYTFEFGEGGSGCFGEDCFCRLEQDGLYTVVILPNIDKSYGPFDREVVTMFLQEYGYKKADDYSSLTVDEYWFGKEIGLLINPKVPTYGAF